jgi:hypothetical protein
VYNGSIAYPLTDITIQNNIFYNNGDSSGDVPALSSVKFDDDMADELTMNNNLYWSPDGDQGWIFRINYGTHRRIEDWSDFKADYALFEVDSPTPADPLFVDAANGDFRISINSPAYHAGSPIGGVSTDYNGNAYHATTPSLGAFEVVE